MTTAEIIVLCATNSELRFLVIGGLAVIAHGYPRHTMDLDYLVRRSDRDAWRNLLAGHNYEPTHEHENFTQFTSRAGWIDLDLMFVNDSTFEAMFAASELKSLGTSKARFPSLQHLIALKLHVIKQNIPHRVLGDMDDVINLLLANQVDVRQENWRQLFLKYATLDVYEKIRTAISP
jgi:hypothetical protein